MGKHSSLYWATFYSLMHGTKFKIPLELTRVIYKFIPTFGKLTDLQYIARYQAKSRDKLVNHSCQLV